MATPIDYTCAACGARLEPAPGRTLLICGYCGTVKDVGGDRPPPPEAPAKLVVPASLDAPRLRDRAREILIGRESAPLDVLDKGRFVETTLGFVPMWLCRGAFRSHWSASFGFWEAPVRPAAAPGGGPPEGAAPRLDWRPATGVSFGRFARAVFAGTPGDPPEEAVRLLESLPWEEAAVPFDPAVHGDLDFGDPSAGEGRARRAARDWVETVPAPEAARSHSQGDEQRDWAVNTEVVFDEPIQRLLVPAAKCVHEYEGTRRVFWFAGESFSAEWHSELPEAPVRPLRPGLGFLPVAVGSIFTLFAVAAVAAGVSGRGRFPPGALVPLAMGLLTFFFRPLSRRLLRALRRARRAWNLARAREIPRPPWPAAGPVPAGGRGPAPAP